MICKKCGAEIADGLNVCDICGYEAEEATVDLAGVSEEPTVVMNAPVETAGTDDPTVAVIQEENRFEEEEPTVSDPQVAKEETETEDNSATADYMPVDGGVSEDTDSLPAQKKNKGLVIGIVVLAVIAVAAIVMCVLFATGVIDLKNKDTDTTNPTTQQVTEEKPDYDFQTAVQVGDMKVTNAQFDYYYSMSYQYFQQMEMQYQQYGMSLGFPIDKSPDKVSTGQKDENGNDLYYDKVIADYASNLIHQQFALYAEAKAAGYTLNAEEKQQIDDAFANLKEQAEEENLSVNGFIWEYYSAGLDEKSLRDLLEVELIASRYYQDLEAKASESITDAQIEAEYNANPEAYASYTGNSTDVRHCLITFSTDATDEEKKTAYDKAEKIRNEFIGSGATEEAFIEIVKKYNEDTASTATGGLYEGVTAKSNFVTNFKNWAIDPARKAGDCEIVETEYGYHIMYFVKNNGPEWKTVIRGNLQKEATEKNFDTLIGENGKYKIVKNEAVIEKSTADFCKKLNEQLSK